MNSRLRSHFSARPILLVFFPAALTSHKIERARGSDSRTPDGGGGNFARMGIKIRVFFAKDDIEQSIVKVDNIGSDIFLTFISSLQIFFGERTWGRHAKEERVAQLSPVLAITKRRVTFPAGKGVSPGVLSFADTSERKSKFGQVRITFWRTLASSRRRQIYLSATCRRWFYRKEKLYRIH